MTTAQNRPSNGPALADVRGVARLPASEDFPPLPWSASPTNTSIASGSGARAQAWGTAKSQKISQPAPTCVRTTKALDNQRPMPIQSVAQAQASHPHFTLLVRNPVRHAPFAFAVDVDSESLAGTPSWTVEKTEADLMELDRRVRRLVAPEPLTNMPLLPDEKAWSDRTESSVSRRHESIRKYLNFLLQLSGPGYDAAHAFLSPTNSTRLAAAALHSRDKASSVSGSSRTSHTSQKSPVAEAQQTHSPTMPSQVVFGSIGASTPSRGVAPDVVPRSNGVPGPCCSFSIGVKPGGIASRVRLWRTKHLQSAPSNAPGVIDLTEHDRPATTVAPIRWQFGTTTTTDPALQDGVPPLPSPHKSPLDGNADEPSPVVPPHTDVLRPLLVPPGFETHGTGAISPLDLGIDAASKEIKESSATSTPTDMDGTWIVQDYGYGFGNGTGADTHMAAKERRLQPPPQRPRQEASGPQNIDEEVGQTRSYRGGRGGQFGNGIRRGRTNGRYRGNAGFGRGIYNGGGYTNGAPTPAYGYSPRASMPPHPPAPFEVTPPPHYQSLEMMNGGLYPGYIPVYEPYPAPAPLPPLPPMMHFPPQPQPPVPVPMTPLSFQLDPVRYYLLGQLEYYMSPQNMAQDFFLRNQMDNRGWIHISLFATFKRVKQLTDSVHLVREVFSLSSVVQVHGDWVRMGGWEQYVLPNAPASTVEETFTFNGHPPHRPHLHLVPPAPPAPQPQEFQKNAPTGNDEGEGDDEVEIVLGDEVQSLSARRPA